MATTTKPTWTDYALLQSSKDPKKAWRVQVNEEGEFRCTCPAYIFSGKGGKPRTCKHIRHVKEVEGERWRLKAKPATWDQAAEILEEVLAAGLVFATDASKSKMTLTLATRLQDFVPPAGPVEQELTAGGLRLITFDD